MKVEFIGFVKHETIIRRYLSYQLISFFFGPFHSLINIFPLKSRQLHAPIVSPSCVCTHKKKRAAVVVATKKGQHRYFN